MSFLMQFLGHWFGALYDRRAICSWMKGLSLYYGGTNEVTQPVAFEKGTFDDHHKTSNVSNRVRLSY